MPRHAPTLPYHTRRIASGDIIIRCGPSSAPGGRPLRAPRPRSPFPPRGSGV